METPPVTLGQDEQRRLYVLTELLAGRLTTIEAALTLDTSTRHLKRLKARYRREGVASLAHGNRGRRPLTCHRSRGAFEADYTCPAYGPDNQTYPTGGPAAAGA